MAVAAFPLVGLEFATHGAGEVVPVVQLAALLPLIQVSLIKVEQYRTLGPCNSGHRPAYALHRDIILFARNTMLLNPLELFGEKFL